jgi:hypothetical protein
MADDDFSELGELSTHLESAPDGTLPFINKALEVTARNLKDGWRSRARINRWYPKSYADAISYDMHEFVGFGGAEAYAEVGPKLHTTPGASAGFLEEGGGGVDGPAHHAGRDALEAVEDDYVKGLEIALADGLAKALGAS